MPFSVVLSESLANKIFGEHSPIGEIIHDKNGTNFTVTGIMKDIPYNSHIEAKAFISIKTLRRSQGNKAFNCGDWGYLTYINLFKNSNSKEAEAKINTILKDNRMKKIPLEIEPLKKIYFDYDNNKYDGCMHGNLQTTLLYLAIGILILFIVIFNYINLSTAISVSRIKEFSIRRIIGAKRKPILPY